MRINAGDWLVPRARRVGVTLVLLLLALARPAAAQGIGLEQLREMMDWGTGSLLLFDELEYAPGASGQPVGLEATAWYGGAYNRLWVRAEGEQLTAEGGGEAEVEALYGRLITPYFDAVGGVRVDGRWGEDDAARALLVLGVQGLAPYWFEIAPTLYVSQDGDLSGRFAASYELLFTQRLIAEPELEVNAALQEVPEFGVGAGFNDVELGLRLRYEIRREVAPYFGYSWTRRVGGSADFARAEGEPVSDGAFVAGLRMWF
ncbi:MAG TPA: copper resistance protein B [Longimicrobiaceae bacterium]|nr:copper resistance protein B [Longimicrobiaceae bacterium]